ncbi:MAG: hypothetical protein A3H95_09635 [Acidobacteria bacterium RIFCSPLOWO2_02_FULL_64_15]|nr:MAG: hypothetical protein A3H95_09635 [Acidobacteria bacterium RIFCSPLOWO2_02_FULL_64_15]
MKAVIGSVVAAVAASACCLGPVVFSLVGAGALGAASMRLEPYRPWFLGLTAVLLGMGFVATDGRQPAACADGTCAPSSRRTARIMLWLAVVLVGLLATFPYYATWLI